jgi:hypothetical protein
LLDDIDNATGLQGHGSALHRQANNPHAFQSI